MLRTSRFSRAPRLRSMAARRPGPSPACSVRICPATGRPYSPLYMPPLAWPDCRHGLQEMADLGAGRKGREVGRFSSPSVIHMSQYRRAEPIGTAILLLPGC